MLSIRSTDELSSSLGSLAHVELRHLLALRAVAEQRSFGRAATVLGYTQSAVSQQIGALEKLVGTPLFDRPGGPRAVTLTRAGELLLVHAEAVLDRLRVADSDLEAFRQGEGGRLEVGTFQSVSVRILPDVVRRLRSERPALEIALVESDDNDDLIARIERGGLDVSFIVGPPPASSAVSFELLGHDPFVLLSPADAPVAAEGPVPFQMLSGLPLIAQNPNACQLLVDDGMRRRGVEPTVVFRSGDNAAVQAMVRAGMGHAVLPRLAVDLDDPGVVVLDLEPPLPPRALGVITPTGRAAAPAVEAFVQTARSVCRDLLPSVADAA